MRHNFTAILIGVALGVIFILLTQLFLVQVQVEQVNHRLNQEIQATCKVPIVTTTTAITIPTTKVITVPVQFTVIQTNTVEVSKPAPTWIALSGEWALTYYGENDEAEGARTGASWNGYSCPDWQNYYRYGLVAPIPSNVDDIHYGVAMPGAEFYCLPIKVCNGDKCAIGVAVDVPADYVIDGYMHADMWPAMAEELGVTEPIGIVKGGVRVYVGNGVK